MTAPHDLVHKAFEPDDNIGSGIFAELEAQEKAKEKALEDQAQIKAGLVECMDSPSSRAAIAWILELTGVEGSVTSPNPMKMMMASARRDVGLALRDALQKASPARYRQMLKEYEDGRDSNH